MSNLASKSLLEIAYELVEKSEAGLEINELLDQTLLESGNELDDVELRSALYIDICSSSKFVYLQSGLWDLKIRHSLDEYDKDGSKLYSKDELHKNESSDDEDDDDEDKKSSDDEDEESDDEDNYDDEDEDDETEDSYGDSDDEDYVNDDSDSDFDEDDYLDKMDEYEDMYE